MPGALKYGYRSLAILVLVVNAVGELQPKITLAALRSFLAAARLSCFYMLFTAVPYLPTRVTNCKCEIIIIVIGMCNRFVVPNAD